MRPSTISASGIGHHQRSQKAVMPWLLTRPAQKRPRSRKAVPTTWAARRMLQRLAGDRAIRRCWILSPAAATLRTTRPLTPAPTVKRTRLAAYGVWPWSPYDAPRVYPFSLPGSVQPQNAVGVPARGLKGGIVVDPDAAGGREPGAAPPGAPSLDAGLPPATPPAVPPPAVTPEAAPPPGVPGQEDVLGPRTAAALIDIVVLTGLFVIVAAIVGGFSVGGGAFSISLGGPWFLLYLALLLLYYFAFETATGQSVGKLLFGLRVQRAEGGRPSAGAIAGRTVLRIVDWLPLFYLIGFIAMLGTGVRRQRLGDIAANTVVARAAPLRNRALAVIPLAVVLVAAIGLAASRGGHPAGGPQTYRGHGVSFVYPGDWQQ
jgi:uncharacterized RDD family membrane protein YckC